MSTTETNAIDDYQLHNMIAVGSQSQIWEVSPQGSSDRFAMKLLLPDQFKEAEVLSSFKAESKMLASFNHPNIIKFNKYVKTKQHAYFIMELFRAPSLRGYLQNDLLGLRARFKRLVELTCIGLGYIHEKGWVHKDVKPENILLSKGSEVRLLDFALCTRYATGVAK
ncbi:MAG: protein kinase, partial [Planctomycetota bacterium]|nr:protein kinase [Planctomycetota bacterium]